MTEQQIERLIARFDSGNADPDDLRQIETLIASGRILPEDFESLRKTRDLLDEAIDADQPQWSGQLYTAIEEEKRKQPPKHRQRWMMIPIRYAAVGALLVGLGLGWLLHAQLSNKDPLASSDMAEIKEALFISLMRDASAPTRLKAVYMSQEDIGSSEAIIRTLIHTLQRDPSTNVRLAAVDALAPHLKKEYVQDALIEALQTNSPMITLRIAELLAEHRRYDLESVYQLLDTEGVTPGLREQLELSIEQLKI